MKCTQPRPNRSATANSGAGAFLAGGVLGFAVFFEKTRILEADSEGASLYAVGRRSTFAQRLPRWMPAFSLRCAAVPDQGQRVFIKAVLWDG